MPIATTPIASGAAIPSIEGYLVGIAYRRLRYYLYNNINSLKT